MPLACSSSKTVFIFLISPRLMSQSLVNKLFDPVYVIGIRSVNSIATTSVMGFIRPVSTMITISKISVSSIAKASASSFPEISQPTCWSGIYAI